MKIELREMTDNYYGKYDIEAAKVLNSFLPNEIFDAHMHITNFPAFGRESLSFDDYYKDAEVLFGKDRKIYANGIAMPDKKINTPKDRESMVTYIKSELDKHPDNVAEILVCPDDTPEYIESQLSHPRIKGLKCYHMYAKRPDTFNAGIGEYLPESAWEVANKRGLAITLHMVKNEALAHPDNLAYITEKAKKYPKATLILAHAARSFAAWTAIENIEKVKHLENVVCDFGAVCESPAMIQCVKKLGSERCMWGSDWAVSMLSGKCVSLGGTFYWINGNDLRSFKSGTDLMPYVVGTENLMAMKELSILMDLTEREIENIFSKTAKRIFSV